MVTQSDKVGRDEPCPCGSGKTFNQCHGGGRVLPPLQDIPEVDTALLSLVYNSLNLLKDAISSVSLPAATDANAEDLFRKQTLLHFAKKVYRATLAGVTLLRTGQSTQAFTLKREQHHAWVAFSYYFDNEPESVLFMAAGPLRQRDNAQKIMSFDDNAAKDPERLRQLEEHRKMAEQLYKRFPGLKVPKGKSGRTGSPSMIDWSEPSEFDMMREIVKKWPDEMAKLGQPLPENSEEWVEKETRKAHFYHSGFPSFDMHGNPMGLIAELNNEGEDTGADLGLNNHEPNSVAYIYAYHPVEIAERLVELSGADGFDDRLKNVVHALKNYENKLT